MTNDGNFNVNNVNTINIPSVSTGIVYPGIAFTTTGTINLRSGFYYDSKYFYSLGAGLNGCYRAPINDIINGTYFDNSQPGGFTEVPTSIYHSALSGYFYAFSGTDAFGGEQGGTIWRTPSQYPMTWYNTGVTTPSNTTNPMIYVDSTNIYLIGGVTGGNGVASIDVAAIATPTSFATSGNTLPDGRYNAPLVTVDTTIYMYGGLDSIAAERDTVFSAATSDPTTWTDLGSLLPVPLQGACGYTDGTYVWLFGGQSSGFDVDTIYRAPVGTPTSFTSVGTLPAQIGNLTFYSSELYGYLIHPDGTVWKSLLSDLITWTVVQPCTTALPTAVRSSHIATVDSTVYLFGGYTGTSATDATLTDHIQSASTTKPLEWTDLGALLPTTMAGGQLIKTKNYLYILGGKPGTGNYYRALLSAPTSWSLAGGSGPLPRGRAAIIDGEVYYFGGESAFGIPQRYIISATINPNSSPTGDISDVWKTNSDLYHKMSLPAALSRFTLIIAGDYIYVLGGITTAAAMNSSIYRSHKNTFRDPANWVTVGTISNPMVDANLVLINNYVYIVGGGPSGAFTTSDNFVLSASMTDLANGNVLFVEEDSAGPVGAENAVTTINNDVYFIGGRTITSPISYVTRTGFSSSQVLALPRSPEATHSLPTIDLKSGALGSYTSFQRTGMLPWLITDI